MNCVIIDDDRLSRKVVEEFVNKTDSLELLASFPSAVEAINAFTKIKDIHLIFLDIEMPEMSGMELLNNMADIPQIIIISAKEKYALEAFEHDVDDYLLKPVSYSRFYKAVEKAKRRFELRRNFTTKKDEIFIKKSSSYVRLKYNDILWIEALENYVIVSTFNDKFTIHFTMKSIEKKLPAETFKRIHRSFIININRINSIEDNAVVIDSADGSKVIPIGKSYKEKLMDDLNLMIK